MLKITIPDKDDIWDESKGEFIVIKGTELQLEHSLISLRKWESKWHKSFLSTKEKTYEEILDYIRCMTLNSHTDQNIYNLLTPSDIEKVIDYINNPHTATTFSDKTNMPGSGKREIVTAEIIYYWMISLNIPSEYQKWHLNQLLALIKVISIKNSPKKKMSKKDQAAQTAALNKARRAKYNSKG